MRKIKAVVFDLDNTLVDFMRMKRSAVRAAAEAMVGAGLKITPDEVYNEVFKIYEKEGMEAIGEGFGQGGLACTRRQT